MVSQTLIDAIIAQERALVLDTWDDERAWQLGTLLRAEAVAQGWAVAIDIRLFHRPQFFCAMPGTTPDNLEWLRRKRNTVERFHKSSFRVGREMALKGSTLTQVYGLPLADFVDHGGGFPIQLPGVGAIGVIGVSGLPQQDDHMAIVTALCGMLGRDPAGLQLPG